MIKPAAITLTTDTCPACGTQLVRMVQSAAGLLRQSVCVQCVVRERNQTKRALAEAGVVLEALHAVEQRHPVLSPGMQFELRRVLEVFVRPNIMGADAAGALERQTDPAGVAAARRWVEGLT